MLDLIVQAEERKKTTRHPWPNDLPLLALTVHTRVILYSSLIAFA